MKSLLIYIMILPLHGCASWVTPSPAKNITLEQAMLSVARGLNNMEKESLENGKGKTNGLIPTEVEIQFNVSAAGSDKGSLKLVDSANSANTLDLGGERKGERANKVVVKLTSILSGSSWIKDKSPSEIIENLNKAGMRLEGATVSVDNNTNSNPINGGGMREIPLVQ